MAERLGILGGTFDPVHVGHVLLAQSVREQLDLRRVVFVPAADPPHKTDLVASADHRVEMVRLAVDQLDGFEVSCVELERAGPSYTVDTLRWFRQHHPDSELYLIIGADNIAEMATWYSPEAIFDLATVVSGSRDESLDRLPAAAMTDFGNRIRRVPTPTYDISSTTIRQRLQLNLPIRFMVPEAVEQYLANHGLYAKP